MKKDLVVNKRVGIVLTLKFKNESDKEHPLPDQRDMGWYCSYTNISLVTAVGPPAQLFFPHQPKQLQLPVNAARASEREARTPAGQRARRVSTRMLEDPTTVGDGRVSDGDKSDAEEFWSIEEQDTAPPASSAAAARPQ